jgi:beta-xylosidase
VLRDDEPDGTPRYFMVCTKGDQGGLFTIHQSPDLVHWAEVGYVFPAATGAPVWATANFWAPEIHAVNGGYVAYFSAQHVSGKLAVGAAWAPSPLGPFEDLGEPLVHEPDMSHIDAHLFEADGGTRYLVWKDDGNAFGLPTPIWGQEVTPDGLTLVGPKVKLITNDKPWEGNLVEGPWVVRRPSGYYLFYSGNAFYNASYAMGVARADSPLGPYTKLPNPILTSKGAWAGPGHGSLVVGPSGRDMMVYHSWEAAHIGEPPGRIVLVDEVEWNGQWPSMFGAPSSASRPKP